MKKNSRYFIGLMIFAVFIGVHLAPRIGFSEEISPSDVYQRTEQFKAVLDEAGYFDEKIYEAEKDDDALRHPRHVMQKVRECHTIVSKILRSRNIEPSPLPEMSSLREIRPADVLEWAEHLILEAKKLDGGAVPFTVSVEDGKLPGDVYNNLKRICRSVTTKITPSDVYQVATAVRDGVLRIAAMRGYEIDVQIDLFEGKSPDNVYDETYAFLDDLRILAFNPDYAIPGGVIIPNELYEGDAVPQNAIALMNDALAEVEAIKYTLGVREQITPPLLYEEGKTPSDVFGRIEHAHRLLLALLALEEEAEREILEQ